MVAFNKFNTFVADIDNKVHNLGADVLKVMLTNSAPIATNTVKANITDIAAGNGYTAGGTASTLTSSSQTSGTYKLILQDVVFTAAGGAIGPFRYAVLYNSTAAGGPLIGWWDFGSNLTLNSGDTFTWHPDATNGVLQVA